MQKSRIYNDESGDGQEILRAIRHCRVGICSESPLAFHEKEPNWGDFFNGFFATLMATPCSAPFVGTAITAAFTQSYAIGISIFLFMGIGMSLPYLLIASFPKLIKFLPKPGKWMVHVKYILGLLLLATVLWLLNILSNFFNTYFLILLIIFFLVLS